MSYAKTLMEWIEDGTNSRHPVVYTIFYLIDHLTYKYVDDPNMSEEDKQCTSARGY